MKRVALACACVGAIGVLSVACSAQPEMSFFVTSVRAANGGNIGGLEAADAHCQKLADAGGSTKRQWRAYLSGTAADGQTHVNARDRIGPGPWFNVRGVQVAATVDQLHGASNNLGASTSLDEHGNRPSQHDILTGTDLDGTLMAGDATCRNWTSTDGRAMVGHSNKAGNCCGTRAQSWNAAHLSAGCSVSALQQMGGAGLFYCFAGDEPSGSSR